MKRRSHKKTMPTRRRSADLSALLRLCTEEVHPCKCSLHLSGSETHSQRSGCCRESALVARRRTWAPATRPREKKTTRQNCRVQAGDPPPSTAPHKYCVCECVRPEMSSAPNKSSFHLRQSSGRQARTSNHTHAQTFPGFESCCEY